MKAGPLAWKKILKKKQESTKDQKGTNENQDNKKNPNTNQEMRFLFLPDIFLRIIVFFWEFHMTSRQVSLLVFRFEFLYYSFKNLPKGNPSKDSFTTSFRDFYGLFKESFQKLRFRKSEISSKIPPKIRSEFLQESLKSSNNLSEWFYNPLF